MNDPVKLEDFVREAVAQSCRMPMSEVHADTRLADLRIDSLTFVSLVSQVEALYDVAFWPEDVLSLMGASTVADLVEGLRGLIDEQTP